MFIVTGAAGFIGSAFVWELNQRGITDIICVDDFGQDSRWKNLAPRKFLHFVRKDALFDFLAQPDVIDAVKAVFHMGACSATTEMNMDFLLENNHYYTQNLWKYCTKNKKPFVYASSAATYGAGENGYDDQTPSEKLIPLNPYGYSKLLFDRWALQQKNSPPFWGGLKFFNVYGPNENHKGDMASVVFKAFHQIKKDKSLRLFKSYNKEFKHGMQMRDFVYIKDVTRWMWELHEKRPGSGIYNMGSGKARTWIDLGTAVFKNLKVPRKIQWIEMPKEMRAQYQYFTQAKMDKLSRAGLSKAQWSLEEGVQDYVQNYLSPGHYL